MEKSGERSATERAQARQRRARDEGSRRVGGVERSEQLNTAPLVEMIGISKSYGGVRACRDVDLTVRAGEVHALLGENGAGKSTLMRVLSGDVTDYEGEVRIGGEPRRFNAPVDAQRAGVAMIHQELDLVPGLSVAENIFLGREPRNRLRVVDRRRMNQVTGGLLERCGVALDPRRPVGELRTGEQQLVTVAKALSLDARVLIMDEPTSALSPAEVEQTFTVIGELRREGVGIVYISHRMDEIGRIADRATVLRNGAVVTEFDARELTAERAAEAMVGRPVQTLFRIERSEPMNTERAAGVWTERAAEAPGSGATRAEQRREGRRRVQAREPPSGARPCHCAERGVAQGVPGRRVRCGR